MKKGQLFGQSFVYIFYALVIVLVMFFGVKWISDLNDLGNEVEYNQFLSEFESKLSTVSSDNYGSTVFVNDIRVPAGVDEICILDSNVVQNFNVVSDSILAEYMNITYSQGSELNVFFAGDKVDAFTLDAFGLESSPLCDPTIDGIIDMKLLNNGSNVIVRLI